MRNAQKTVIALTVENQTHKTSAKEAVALEEITGTKEGKSFYRKLSLLLSLSVILLNLLDALFLSVLLPYTLWLWVYENNRAKIVIKAAVEVTLELLMWVIFAGASILMTATFVVEDVYYQKNDTEEPKQLPNEQNETTSSDNTKDTNLPEIQDSSNENEKSKIPNNQKSIDAA